jgi:hypothetical protein
MLGFGGCLFWMDRSLGFVLECALPPPPHTHTHQKKGANERNMMRESTFGTVDADNPPTKTWRVLPTRLRP